MNYDLTILPQDLLPSYVEQVNPHLQEAFTALHDSELSIDTFSFYTSVSAVFSSKIEGEPIELDSYIKHKRFGIRFQPDYTKKIDDLYTAYRFAADESLNQSNAQKAHAFLTKHILPTSRQGKYRTVNMYVTTPDGRIEYVAAAPEDVLPELKKLYADMDALLQDSLTTAEVFFFASFIHLVAVKIHPFDDGNGRAARLLEKWFIAQKLGPKAWFIQSEKQYYTQHQTYYKNIRALGLEYPLLDYSKALPFLLMLPNAITHQP